MSGEPIKRPKQLILIRHGESMRNEAKKGSTYFADDEARRAVMGVADHKIPLTAEGIRQARTTGIYLKRKFGAPHYVYHSGYKRTVQTAEEILSAFTGGERAETRVRMNSFIRERDPGYAYDMTTDEARTAFPWLREYWETFGGFFARPPGGESLADVAQRVYTFINMLFRDRRGMKIWVVTHGGTLRCFRFILERWTYEQALCWPEGQSPKNCGITIYDFDDRQKRLVLQEYNKAVWE